MGDEVLVSLVGLAFMLGVVVGWGLCQIAHPAQARAVGPPYDPPRGFVDRHALVDEDVEEEPPGPPPPIRVPAPRLSSRHLELVKSTDDDEPTPSRGTVL